MAELAELEAELDRLTVAWLDAICTGTPAEVAAAAEAVHRVDEACWALRRRQGRPAATTAAR